MKKLLLVFGISIALCGAASAQFLTTAIPCAFTNCTVTGLTVNGNASVVSGSFGLSGDISAPTWTTNGVRYKNVAATLTDTTAATGTTALAYTDVWGGNTIAATNASVVFTNYYGSFFKKPVAGTNVTLTNPIALGADNLALGGATIGTDALGVTGTATISGAVTLLGSGNLTLGTGGTIIDGFGGTLEIKPAGTAWAQFANSATASFVIRSTGTMGWSSTTDPSLAPDLRLTRAAAASLQLGAADVDTAPVAQTLRTQGALAGGTSNVAGANWTFIASPGKGTGAGGSFIFQTTPAGSTGTTVNAPVTGLSLNSAGLLANPTITSDAALVDTTVCQDTTLHGFHAGSGAVGICLGTSTRRFKRDIIPMADSLFGITKLKLVNFRYQPGHGFDPEKYQNGLLVEDVIKVFPDCTGLGPDKKPLNLDAFCIVFHSLKAQQEQQKEIVALQTEVAMLEHRRK